VSDPRWNRLVFGEMGRTLRAYNGQGQTLVRCPTHAAWRSTNAIACMSRMRATIASWCCRPRTVYGEITLSPSFEIRGISGPYDVSYSDGGNAVLVAGDDWLYVAETGKNRVLAYTLGSTGAQLRSTLGDLGSARATSPARWRSPPGA